MAVFFPQKLIDTRLVPQFGLGLAICAAAACLVAAPASGQSVDDEAQRGAAGASRASQPSRVGDPALENSGDALSTDFSPAIRNSDASAEDPDRTLEIIPPQPDQPGLRPIVRDGDLNVQPRRPTPRDGVIEVGAPPPILDGTDPTQFDTRPQTEIDLFETPPAGHDPLLFQIEDIEPRRDDRRPRRLFRIEPFDPVGVKVGSFVLFPEVETGLRTDSNVLSSQNPESDIAYTLTPSARLVSDWSRHALEFNARATLSFFSEFDSENDRGYFVESRGRLDFTRRTNLQALISQDFSQESRSAIDASNALERTDVLTRRGALTLNHRFNRLTIQLRGSVETQDYSDDVTNGIISSNDDRDIRETEQAIRATWEFKPTLSAFAEVGFIQRSFGAPSQADNIQRDSTGERYRIGLDFGDTGQYLRGEISVGYGIEHPDASQLDDVEAFLFDANASWRMTRLTTLLLNARSDIQETNTAASGGVVTHFIGLEARHAFRRYLIGTLEGSISTREFDGTTLEESEWQLGTGLEYFLNRNFVVFGNYLHTDFDSSSPNSSFVSDEFRLGLRWRR